MKKIYLTILIFTLLFGFGTVAFADWLDPFLSIQEGYTPVDSYILQTDGTDSTWILPSAIAGIGDWIFNAFGQLTPSSTVDVLLPANATITDNLYVGGNATSTHLAADGGNSDQWNTAFSWGDYSLAGYYLSADFNGDWDDRYNATTTLNGFTPGDYLLTSNFQSSWDTSANASSTIGNKSYSDLEGNPSDVITAGTNLSWSGDTLNATGGSSGNPFNQWLDTTSSPQFNSVTTTDNLLVGGKLTIDTGITDVLKATAGVVSEVGSPTKNYALLWNGTAPVWAAQGTSFTFSIATFSDNATASQEIGTGDSIAIGGISFSATYSNGPATSGSVQIQSGTTAWASALELTGGSYEGPTTNTEAVTYPAAPGTTVRFRLTSGDGTDNDTSDTTIVYNNNRFWGVTTKTSSFTEADVEGLAGSELSNSKDKTFSSTTGAGQYILWASRKALGTVTFSVDGFSGGFQSPETVSITNASGYTEDYYVYRSTNPNLGTITVIAD